MGKRGRQKGMWKCGRCERMNVKDATHCGNCMRMREQTQYGIIQSEEIHLFESKKARDERYIQLNEQGRLKKTDHKVIVTVQEG